MSAYSAVWAAWLVTGVVVESTAFALRRRRKRPTERDTLSRNLQWALVDHSTVVKRATLAGYFGVCIWIAFHLWG